jgi:signal transduction histidine kinase
VLKANLQRIIIRTGVEDNWLKITIADNGPGIPAEIQANIFDHLFTTKEVGKGTGLGLAIARQIVEDKHGGSLAVHSEAGQGTEFRIQLPLS